MEVVGGGRGEGREGTRYGQRNKQERGKGRQQVAGKKEQNSFSLSPSDDDFRVKDTGGWKERRNRGKTAEEEGGERQRLQGESRRGEGEAGEQS